MNMILKKRAVRGEKPSIEERATCLEETKEAERATPGEKTIINERPTSEDFLAVRLLVRTREDFQAMRKKMDNRLGLKADGDSQNVEARAFRTEDVGIFKAISEEARRQEAECEKNLKKILKRFPVYNDFLSQVKGVGPIAAGWIISEFDIRKATTVSKMWQYAGLNPGMVRGKKRVEHGDGSFDIIDSDEMVKGDRLTPGHVSPFNRNLRTALVGVLADGFIKQQNYYAMEFYYPYKTRLEQEKNPVTHVGKSIAWEDVTKGHRDRAAKRYMIKMFLKDLYTAWRTVEGLPVREPYQVEYLGHKHGEQ